jgi:hypothetical protein
MTNLEWITTIGIPEAKNDPKNRNKGLIPRFHQLISDRFYGFAGKGLAATCGELEKEGKLKKGFIKFSKSEKDNVEGGIVVEGPHKNMKIGKDGRLSTPIYWIPEDPEIPEYFKNQDKRQEAYRLGKQDQDKEFVHEEIM